MTKDNKIPTTPDEIGGKAYGLSILKQMGYSVPEYFVVTSDQDINDPELHDVINKFTSQFNKFAVRSSANIEDGAHSSFAGQFSSYLDVSADEIVERIKDVRNSAKTEHVKAYCQAMGLAITDIKMNVIIQRFDEPDSGGVWMGNGLFGGRLEWVEGRGDKVVNGETTPYFESYREDGQLLSKSAEHRLADRPGKPIAQHCQEVQAKLGYAADLEFCIIASSIRWLQLRRVTREASLIANDSELNPEENIIKGEAASPYAAKGSAYRLDQKQGDQWGSGKILVARATSPNDMMYIMTSEGVVTKMGGMLSHSAVVCRELGKACVVGVDIERIHDGADILVDGISGEVHLL